MPRTEGCAPHATAALLPGGWLGVVGGRGGGGRADTDARASHVGGSFNAGGPEALPRLTDGNRSVRVWSLAGQLD